MADRFGIVVVDVSNREYGALIVYPIHPTIKNHLSVGTTTTIYALDNNGKKSQAYYVPIKKYTTHDGSPVHAAVFPKLPVGNYVVYLPGSTNYGEKKVTIFPGSVAEVSYDRVSY